MKKRLVAVDVDGEEIIFETSLDVYGPDGELNLKSRREREDTCVMDAKFADLVKQIKPVTDCMLGALSDNDHTKEIKLEFGIKVGSKSGMVFTSLDSSPNFKVSIKSKSSKQ